MKPNYLLIFVCLAGLLCISNLVLAVGSNFEATTKDGVYVCNSKELIIKASSAVRSKDTETLKKYFNSGDCRQLKPNIEVLVTQEGEWGQPIEISINGKKWWGMQHMLIYSEAKENENELAKLYFAGGVWLYCKWQNPKVMVKKLMLIGDFGIQKKNIGSDRVYELQKMHLREGKEFAIKNGCDHPIAQRIKVDYEKYFSSR